MSSSSSGGGGTFGIIINMTGWEGVGQLHSHYYNTTVVTRNTGNGCGRHFRGGCTIIVDGGFTTVIILVGIVAGGRHCAPLPNIYASLTRDENGWGYPNLITIIFTLLESVTKSTSPESAINVVCIHSTTTHIPIHHASIIIIIIIHHHY